MSGMHPVHRLAYLQGWVTIEICLLAGIDPDAMVHGTQTDQQMDRFEKVLRDMIESAKRSSN